ncbi:MAG TPA: acyl-ACP--UDP-N-acetylglucosamine O-acyltransferase [Candidatus Omnitrophota bacterium]|nr:acyl-ACP--UDP-N-acetylglucosamine O-acyltransferase [Candidatus Omnitrophota bacterium]HPS37169.1 acyl-ACP--UDP-N-acetylglucosamine O-acyltransferase [Candidatus Omnitrophota bacterium]
MSEIHPSAIIGKNVEIGVCNAIGPNVIIEDGVKIGAHNKILSGALIARGTELGNYNTIHMNAVVGHEPQDLAYRGEETFTKIGNKNVIREFVTIHRGTKAGTATVLGDENFLMAYCHVAHNCHLGSNIIMVNQASLTGHCHVEDRAFLSGMTGFHQFTRIGTLAMVSALSAINKDIPPYVICGGRPAVAQGINVVGMRRAGIGLETRTEIKEAYRLLYRSGLNVSQAVEAIKKSLKSKEVAHMVEFIEASKRGILDGAGATSDTISHRKNRGSAVEDREVEEELS